MTEKNIDSLMSEVSQKVIKQSMIKNCDNCLNDHLDFGDYPCYLCSVGDGDDNMWEPILVVDKERI